MTPARSPPRGDRQQPQRIQQVSEQTTPEVDPDKSVPIGIKAVKMALKNAKPITTATCEDPQEIRQEQPLLEPIIHNTEESDKEKIKKVMIDINEESRSL